MNISLTPETQTFVEQQLATGEYNSANDVVNEALRLMSVRASRLAALQADIQVGITQAE